MIILGFVTGCMLLRGTIAWLRAGLESLLVACHTVMARISELRRNPDYQGVFCYVGQEPGLLFSPIFHSVYLDKTEPLLAAASYLGDRHESCINLVI